MRFLVFALLLLSRPVIGQQSPPAATTISRELPMAMRDGMRFDPPRFAAKPGESLRIVLENADSTHQAHNFIITQPGQREKVVQDALGLAEKGFQKQFVPEGAEVIVHSALLDPEKKSVIEFKVPGKSGVYPYVCTFPGHGMIMYGAMYVDVEMPPLEKDLNLPPQLRETAVRTPNKRPSVQRMFMPDAGPAAIAVALPHDHNVCWDAGQCRLRYAWQGAFIDASAYWNGNGRDLAVLPAKPWWTASKDVFPFRLGSPDAKIPDVKFLGYQLEEGFPEFHYRLGATEVWEKLTSNNHGISARYRFPNNKDQVIFTKSSGEKWKASAGVWKGNQLLLTGEESAEFTLHLGSPHHAH